MNQNHTESLVKLGQVIMPLIMLGKQLGFTREEITERMRRSADAAARDTGTEPELTEVAQKITDIAIAYVFGTDEENDAALQRTFRDMLDAGQSPNQIEAQIKLGIAATGADAETLARMQQLLREEVNREQI